ncbi:HIT domain-containing protein [Dehalococcoides sp. THU3]|uniref:HIT family protein n=1 Tax=Dehalococcoides TaxID=61434 RepID=UPI0032184E80
MDNLWAPWRAKYIEKAVKNEDSGCIFCTFPAESEDRKNLILFRGKYNFVILNAFPYNAGHLMVVPFRHTSAPEELPEEERNEHYRLVCRAVAVLKNEYKPEGFNIGMNLGRVGGAGIDKHIHTHIVPRWNGDTNFMPVIGQTKVQNEAPADTYRRLKPCFQSV